MKADDVAIYFRVDAKNINYVNRIFEGYEYLGVVSTVDKARGILAVRVTPDTERDAREILSRMPISVELVDR